MVQNKVIHSWQDSRAMALWKQWESNPKRCMFVVGMASGKGWGDCPVSRCDVSVHTGRQWRCGQDLFAETYFLQQQCTQKCLEFPAILNCAVSLLPLSADDGAFDSP